MTKFNAQPFGEYYLIERIAVGGMAEIFKAKTYGVGGFEKLLAIKRILPHHAQNQEFITMLIDEAKIAVALNHVNIVQVYDLGKIEEDYFIAMEYVEGRDLRTVMRRCKQENIPLTVDNAVYIMLEICKGLDYAHRKTDHSGRNLDVVHRDISPQNILISFEGEVKIVDFGIAKAANKVTETDTGILKGKFSYMSPEQAEGLEVDRRTDIFSTGIIMYELLTGEKLFPGKNHREILDKIKTTYIEPPFLPGDVPSELEYIIAGALAHDLDQRYSYASDFQVELTKFLYSSSLDFTARNLAGLMRKLFQGERNTERNQDRVDFEVDENTRSMMLASHSHSLVSKSDFTLEGKIPDAKGEATEPQTKNKTIIKKFKNMLQHHAPKPANPKPPEASTDRIPLPISSPRTNPAQVVKDSLRNNEPTPGQVVSRQIQENLTHAAQKFSEMPLNKKIRLSAGFIAILIGLVTVTALLAQFATQKPSDQATVKATPKRTPVNSILDLGDSENPPVKKPADGANIVNFNSDKINRHNTRLVIQTDPTGAEVSSKNGENLRLLGTSPIEIYNIPVGERFELSLNLKNYKTVEKIYVLDSAQEKLEKIKLTPLFGQIEVITYPDGAQVYLDNEPIGQTPLVYDNVQPNTPHILLVKKKGYADYQNKFTVEPDRGNRFTKQLEKAERMLSIQSEPRNAQIYINGINRGITPMELRDLGPGVEYTLLIRSPGYRDYVQKVILKGDEAKRIFANLEPQNLEFGTLILDSVPPEASIFINGQPYTKKTPAILDRLRAGQVYNIRVVKSDFNPIEYRLRVNAEEIINRKAQLERVKGQLRIQSSPPNARIFIDNKFVGETPINQTIESGISYQVTVKKIGFKDQTKEYKMDANNRAARLVFPLETKN